MEKIFVFGSNLAGIHGAGSAKVARQDWWAQHGVGEGRTGQAYAIPTKNERLQTLPLPTIQAAVLRFLDYARNNPDLVFYVVKIGCGLAGYREHHIKPFFKDAPFNVMLPEGWDS